MKSDIIKLYENTNSIGSFFSRLNSPKNSLLKKEFNEIFEKTVYFKDVKKSKQQALYNILHNINEYPTYSDGALKIFKNIKDGYYTEEEYSSNKCRTYMSKIKDIKYLKPVLFHIKECSHSLDLKNKLIVESLKDIFKEDYNLLSKKQIFSYLTVNETKILRCKICRKNYITSGKE